MSDVVKKRYEFVYLFDVKNGNPNGDPDAGNLPRIDPETGHGIVTDVCLKRKVRNYIDMTNEGKECCNIYVKEKAVLSERRKPAYEADEVKKAKSTADKIEKARQWMCKNFYDVRTFGAVMSTKENNCGQVRGPVQIAFAQSIDPITSLEATITRMAVETPREAQSQEGDNRTMGRKAYIPYGLYRVHGFISAPFARQAGFSKQDLDLFWEALMNMFDHDRSAARGEMAARKLIVFEHESELGNAPAHKLFELVEVRKKIDGPPRSFDDYEIVVHSDKVPENVTLIEKI